MKPVDTGPNWPIVGVTGIPRPREWDAVVTAEAPALEGDTLGFVALADGRVLPPQAEPLALALDASLERPYRAEAIRRQDAVWAAGALSIDVVRLEDDPGGQEAELVWDGAARSLRIDGTPSLGTNDQLEALGRARASTYVVFATRIDGPLWAVDVTPL
jgi:hypothetical protein